MFHRTRALKPQSARAPEAWTTLRHLADSAAMKRPKSSGESATTVSPRPSRRSVTAGARTPLVDWAVRVQGTGLGVRARATELYHTPPGRAGGPASPPR